MKELTQTESEQVTGGVWKQTQAEIDRALADIETEGWGDWVGV